MDYKLAKQLKEAGIEQELSKGSLVYYKEKLYIWTGGGHLEAGRGQEYFLYEYGFACCNDDGNAESGFLEVYADDKDLVKILTLSELIEACGEDFHQLSKCAYNGWIADSNDEEDRVTGQSPEEAVAKLYIRLNKK